MRDESLNAVELDAIGEVMNISLGASATAVSSLLHQKVTITAPQVSELPLNGWEPESEDPVVVAIRYLEGLRGSNLLLLRRQDVRRIVEILTGETLPEENFALDELTLSAIGEVMNQMMGAAATALSQLLGRTVNISTPESFPLEDLAQLKQTWFGGAEDRLVMARFRMRIGGLLESEFVNIMSAELARDVLEGFGMSSKQEPKNEKKQKPQQTVLTPEEIGQLVGGTQQAVSETVEAAKSAPVKPRVIDARPAELPALETAGEPKEEQTRNLELILSVPLEISVEIGRTRRKVEDILTFSKGTLVVLDKMAGDQVDLFVNGLCMARGDVVVIDDHFGVRITEVLRQPELPELTRRS